ncbi:UNVERIFIED_CONTAM: hypothetical protein PYX00_006437 [Menopon gallinae]|uniref:Uncharacterized protein n=1 Tax=Menopon gallinae TaxID=328185 RepID=A0AAW2HVA4_9NEOP
MAVAVAAASLLDQCPKDAKSCPLESGGCSADAAFCMLDTDSCPADALFCPLSGDSPTGGFAVSSFFRRIR